MMCLVCNCLRERRGLPFCSKSGGIIPPGLLDQPRRKEREAGGCRAPSTGNRVQRLLPLVRANLGAA